MNKKTLRKLTMKLAMKLANYLLAPVLAAALAFTTVVLAGDGHDHGDSKPSASGPASPRFAAVSDLFELVGVLEGKRLVLYLDYAATNAPVKDAKLELEIGGKKVKVEPHGVGEFEVMFEQEPKDGVLAIAATVSAGKDSDLLAGELDIHLAQAAGTKAGVVAGAAKADAHGHDHKPGEFHFLDVWNKYWMWMIGAAGAVILVGFGALSARRRRSMFSSRTGGAK
jgi:hypothetical protein